MDVQEEDCHSKGQTKETEIILPQPKVICKGGMNLGYGMLSILALLAIIGWVYLIKK